MGKKFQKKTAFGGLFFVCRLRLDTAAGQVFLDHQGYLEGDGIVELPQVQAGELFDLLQPIDQGVPVDEQLSGRLGHVQVVLEELVDGEQRLLIQRVDRILLKDFLQEHLAQGGGQLIDQAADTQVLIVDDVALGVEHLAHLDGDLGLLVALGQIPQVQRQRADAHKDSIAHTHFNVAHRYKQTHKGTERLLQQLNTRRA